jgi:hypothetical protein
MKPQHADDQDNNLVTPPAAVVMETDESISSAASPALPQEMAPVETTEQQPSGDIEAVPPQDNKHR